MKVVHYPEVFAELHERRMHRALQEARAAGANGEIPVGAVIYGPDGELLAKGRNETERLTDVTAHAEIIALSAASQALGAKFLTECTLYVTLEPCVMCAGALRWAQIGEVVYGASDPKGGFMRFGPEIGRQILHPKTRLLPGILERESSNLLSDFFRAKR